ITGEPGFLTVPRPQTLHIGALPPPEDPLAAVLAGAGAGVGGGGGAGSGPRPARIGMIGIEPATRRRMRMNGRAVRDGHGLRVELDQVLSNCPKYIQKRDHHPVTDQDAPTSRTAVDSTELSPAQQRTLRAADTFFIATTDDRGDADASHRGG
ncbi:pyridoxamine 5'-phosphate oxidase family protein, partial [Streptomyces sp. MBT57]|nr:pyridoxamine 5'-phosphate oxidase family protein [Streptomyces sp. MBT57]